MKPDEPQDPLRRRFLKGGALAGAAAAMGPTMAAPAQAAPAPPAPGAAPPPLPNAAAEAGEPTAAAVVQASSGGEFMVDVLKALGFEYVAQNPASSFRGIHEALINYGGNKPEILTCTHEEISVAMAQGYAKMEGKPMACMAHGTVGLQHASMALYNAFVDRAPVYMMVGNIVEGEKRGNAAEWVHSALDPGAFTRDFTKWDDQPATLQDFAEGAVRAYRLAMTPPMAPVLISMDAELQENPIRDRASLRIPRISMPALPTPDPGGLEEVAKLLVAAESPVLVADRMSRNQQGMDDLVALAETLQCAVIDQGGRTNFPSLHPLNQTARGRGVIGQADVVVGLEMNDYWAAVNAFSDRIVRTSRSILKPGAKTVNIGLRDSFTKSNYADSGRYQDVDIALSGDGQSSLPLLTEACRQLIDAGRRTALEARGERLKGQQAAALRQLRASASIGWDSNVITVGRLYAELYEQIRNDDWSLVGEAITQAYGRRLWKADKRYRFNSGSGGWGIGYNIAGSLGGALANRKYGRLSVALQGDGDFNFAPGTLWTAAHHKIPILYVMHNNRAYHQEVMYLQAMCNRLNRGVENAHIGTTLTNPHIDYAMIARGYGLYAEGPITSPKDVGPALKRALDVVRKGEPALIDFVVEPR